MGCEVKLGGRKKKSFRHPREKIEFIILGPKVGFAKKWLITLKLVPKYTIPTLTIPKKFQLSSCVYIGVIIIWKFTQFPWKSQNRWCHISELRLATGLKFCGYCQGRYRTLWYQFERNQPIFYRIDLLPQNCKLDFLSWMSKGFFLSTPNLYLIPHGKIPHIAFTVHLLVSPTIS